MRNHGRPRPTDQYLDTQTSSTNYRDKQCHLLGCDVLEHYSKVTLCTMYFPPLLDEKKEVEKMEDGELYRLKRVLIETPFPLHHIYFRRVL